MSSTALALVDTTEMTEKQVLASALEQMRIAFDEGKASERSTLISAVTIGYHANLAKEALASQQGAFAAWMEKNFGPESKRPISEQWLYKCINAAKAYQALPAGPNKQKAILARYGSIKDLAGIRLRLVNGEDVMADPAPPKAKRGAKTKVERAARQAKEQAAKEAPAPEDLLLRQKDLDRREKVLKQAEKRLEAREAALDEREKDLERREAALHPSDPSDAPVKGDNGLDEARQKARGRGRKAPGSAPTTPADTDPAPTSENAPETADSQSTDGQEQGEEHSDADRQFDQPHHGHAPTGTGAEEVY